MEHDTNALLWQGFFAITMFISTFVSYLLPIIIFTRRNRRIYEVNALGQEEDIHLPHHWSSLGQANVATQLKRIRLKRLLSNCNCISAGVFLGVCFLNLIPYVEEEFGKLIKDFDWLRNFFGTFPLGQFVTVCGLFMVLILESLLSKCFHSQPATVHTGQVVLPILHLDEELNDSRSVHDDHHHNEQEQLLCSEFKAEENPDLGGPSNDFSGHLSGANFEIDLSDSHGHHHHMDIDSFEKQESMLMFFILMFATSIHSLFEGLALGLQTDINYAIHLFIGIILHECLVALALGLNAVRLQQENIRMVMHLKFAFIFSLTIPVGNILGILLGYTPGHFGRFISAIFQGFAAGTFIHVTFLELIPGELLSNNFDEQLEELKRLNSNGDTNQAEQGEGPSISKNEPTKQSDNQQSNHVHPHPHHHHHQVKLRKILLLLGGFLLMAIVPFIFPE